MVLAVVEEVPWKPGGGVDFYIGDCGTVEWDGVVKELQRRLVLARCKLGFKMGGLK